MFFYCSFLTTYVHTTLSTTHIAHRNGKTNTDIAISKEGILKDKDLQRVSKVAFVPVNEYLSSVTYDNSLIYQVKITTEGKNKPNTYVENCMKGCTSLSAVYFGNNILVTEKEDVITKRPLGQMLIDKSNSVINAIDVDALLTYIRSVEEQAYKKCEDTLQKASKQNINDPWYNKILFEVDDYVCKCFYGNNLIRIETVLFAMNNPGFVKIPFFIMGKRKDVFYTMLFMKKKRVIRAESDEEAIICVDKTKMTVKKKIEVFSKLFGGNNPCETSFSTKNKPFENVSTYKKEQVVKPADHGYVVIETIKTEKQVFSVIDNKPDIAYLDNYDISSFTTIQKNNFILMFLKCIVPPLIALRKEGMIYLDLKLDNTMVVDASGLQCCLIDIDSIYCIESINKHKLHVIDSHMPPEFDKISNFKESNIEAWMLGLIVFELLGNKKCEYKKMEASKYILEKTKEIAIHNLLEGMLDNDPTTRLTLENILDYTIFLEAKFDCDYIIKNDNPLQ